MSVTRRPQRLSKTTTWAAIAAAVIVHGTVLGTVHALGLSMVGDGLQHASHHQARVDADELQPSCVGDVLLATTVRAASCLAPWHPDNGEECLADLPTNMWLDLSSCQAQHDPGTAISLVEPKVADRVKPIDVEKLIDEMKQQEEQKAKPVPPVPPPTPAAPPPPPPPPAPARPMQVVETVKPSQEQAPDNARLLAEYDTKVDKQKVARGTPKEPMVAKSKPAELTPTAKPKDEPSVKKLEPDRDPGKDARAPDVPGTLSMRNPGAKAPAETAQDQKTRGSNTGGKGPLVADGFVPRRGDGAIEQQHHEESQQPRGQDGAGGGAPPVPNLKPSQEVLERVVGGGNVDHLDDVDNGDETSLSAKRWIYASFFNRLKRQVAQNWDPGSVWRRADPTGTVYGFKTRITEVRVSLSKSGELSKIVVTQPSGVGDLDDEAVHAFHAAAPFPNPPEGLLSKDNLITFAFSFYFEIGAPRSSWRVIRSM